MINKTDRNLFRKFTASVLISLSMPLMSGAVSEAAGAGLGKQAEPTTAKSDAASASSKASDKRKEIVADAVSSLRETQDALKALDEGNNKAALAGLERATGKLDLVLARDPKVALLPIDVHVVTNNICGSLEAIKNARQDAQKLLADGQVQQARAILTSLTSESIISTTNLPVASYPAALKTAARLIDDNKPNEAKQVLQTALNTLVVHEIVIPLPVAHAQISLARAAELAKLKDRTAAQNTRLTGLLATAEDDIKLAEALGYGNKADFDSFHRQVVTIRQKTSNGKSGNNFFDQIMDYMNSMTKASQHKTREK